ncbi:MAG: serpin family protein [Nostoc sp. ZfuVER08]|uniref:Serpin family protein n=1 Tax=Nostoc punctiforme FACHB-252 TaxID=1357509 RepID=A0ABR8HAC6_NOSPU|nr:serpin family protein [Nostoc punctiforme]MBD2612130.1 serpin family protein [Nostoc punctiforme FACHB-252]MBL1198585.1 serpin family protein [Nostoc sp. GBBB01]MDZ8013090.1 serpin family protein [Nostoc sp. ZfuVER08]
MNRQKFTDVKENFLQRRYGVSLGRRYVLAAASVVLFGVLGCSQVDSNKSALAQSSLPQPETPLEKKTVKTDTKIIQSNNKFGFQLFSEVNKNDGGEKNVFISPSSVAIALAMTYNGASGSTQQAMAKTLELQGMSLSEINSGYAALLKQILENADAKVQLKIANSLWANQEVKFQPDFLQRTEDFYQAKVSNLNFKNPTAINNINDWVKDNTAGKINKIVEKIEPDQVLFLINAIYFKGNWTNEFDKNQTAEYPFYITSGKQKKHQMMSQEGDYKYYENQQFQAVSLPYGKDGKVSFYIFLPKENSNLKAFSQSLNVENWEKWMTQFNKQKGFIRLPRFKTEYDISLNNSLKALGMEEAFSNKANFSGMGQNFAISQVKHKTFLEVNEEGTEAAATTSVGIVATSLRPEPEPFRMIVDRPFFCAIRDNQTGSILFMGSIVEPS